MKWILWFSIFTVFLFSNVNNNFSIVEAQQQAAAPVTGANIAAPEQKVFEPAPLAPTEQKETFLGSLLQLMPMLIVCYFIFYFMVIRPQEKQSKGQKSLLESLKRGDSVVTTSGIVGRFQGMEKEYAVVEVSPNVKVKFEQSFIARRIDEGKKAEAALSI